MKPPMCPVNRVSVPGTHPVADTRIGTEDDFPDWGVGKCAQPQGGDGRAKPDLCHSPCKILGREVRVSANEVGPRVLLACLPKCGPSEVYGVEIREDASNWNPTPKYRRWRKQRSS